jgi:hypothetical protein
MPRTLGLGSEAGCADAPQTIRSHDRELRTLMAAAGSPMS